MNIILTGSTGTLGSQVLFELLKQDHIDNFYLLVREKKGESAKARIQNILLDPNTPNEIREKSNLFLKKINALSPLDFFTPGAYLNKDKINFFIHSAGLVNLSVDPSQEASIFEDNLDFTKKIFNTFSIYINKFTYIGTAFSIGDIGGLIKNDYHNINDYSHRNFYEASKHATEKFLIEQGKQNKLAIQILRPSVLGGNIMGDSKYFISKYMVYYLLGKFFHKTSFNGDSIRIMANFNTGLNIIPVDYTAKVIALVYQMNIEQLNIVHSQSTNLTSGISRIIETVDFTNFTFINADNNDLILENKNRLENFYYNSIGIHLNPYLVSKPYEFDTNLLESILPIPNYDLEDYLGDTINYAKERKFRNMRW